MIETLYGRVTCVGSRGLVVMVSGVGFSVQVADPLKFAKDQEAKLFIHWGWNPDKGPSLYGFSTEFERTVFCALIECPKIGPQISLQALSQVPAAKLLEMIAIGDERAMSSINGIGPKKAKTIISQLQDKAAGILPEAASTQTEGPAGMIDEVVLALKTMGYSAPEISSAMGRVDADKIKQTKDFSELTRLMLSELLKQRSI